MNTAQRSTLVQSVSLTKHSLKTIRDVVESKTVYLFNRKCLHQFHLKMYILISALTTSMNHLLLPKQNVSNFKFVVAFCQSFPERSVGSCLIYCDVRVQTSKSFTLLKRCWKDPPPPIPAYSSPSRKGSTFLFSCTPLQLVQVFIVCCDTSMEGLVWLQHICDSYANETTKGCLKEKSNCDVLQCKRGDAGFILLWEIMEAEAEKPCESHERSASF